MTAETIHVSSGLTVLEFGTLLLHLQVFSENGTSILHFRKMVARSLLRYRQFC
ncbi:cytokinin hydroxylase-like protein [Corchorus olitorius]|uniref:Cytokinin hydroxylase-like protein n=1 Tax=Corchorus olitorius TaxID=93759 RepID=A0A1R3KMR0_9ROSI|nr:cytokinin hydroxylase-like protein [Corchorus olitorius]